MAKEETFTLELIKSMGKREKIYFRRFANLSSQKDKAYLRLYDFLLQEKDFDRERVLAHFEGELTDRTLASNVVYLQEQLLNSFVNYQFLSRKSAPFPKLVVHLQVLYERGFTEKGVRLLRKAKKAAYAAEKLSSLLKLIEMEEEFLFDHGILNFTKELKRLREERKQTVELIDNYSEVRMLKEEVREIVFHKKLFLSPAELADCEALQHPILKDESLALTINARMYWYYAKALVGYVTRDFVSAKVAILEQRRLLTDNPKMFPILLYSQCLSNWMFFSSLLGQREEFEKGKIELQALYESGELESNYYHYIYYIRSLSLAMNAKDHALLREILDQSTPMVMEEHAQFKQLELSNLLDFMIQGSVILEEFQEAARLIHLWNTHCNLSSQYRIFNLIRCIVFFELGHFDLLESSLRSAERYIQQQEFSSKVEAALLVFFEHGLKQAEGTEILAAAQDLHQKLLACGEQHDQSMLITFFDFREWSNGLVRRLG